VRRKSLATGLAGALLLSAAAGSEPTDRAVEREAMVSQQIAARGVRDPRVLAALRKVPRDRFVPAELEGEAYRDHPLPIGNGQTISQPYIVAVMTELAAVEPGEKVLEIGTGSGYQAAILAELGARVVSIEIVPELAEMARGNLAATGFGSVEVVTGDGWKGHAAGAPYDAILVTAAPDRVPEALVRELRTGGRMVLPVGTHDQRLRVLEKTPDGIRERELFEVRFVPMVEGDASASNPDANTYER
jgi:protein-L-isoaspartate(D-aspartate) O-methyltransferase